MVWGCNLNTYLSDGAMLAQQQSGQKPSHLLSAFLGLELRASLWFNQTCRLIVPVVPTALKHFYLAEYHRLAELGFLVETTETGLIHRMKCWEPASEPLMGLPDSVAKTYLRSVGDALATLSNLRFAERMADTGQTCRWRKINADDSSRFSSEPTRCPTPRWDFSSSLS